MNINSHILKVAGKSELPNEIEIGHNYHIALDGSITGFKVEDNEDGTFNKIYDFKPIHIELLTPTGKSLKLADPRKNSQKIRNYLYKCFAEEGYVEDFDDVYDAFANVVMGMTPQLLRDAIKRLDEKSTY